jgi:DNA-binding NarL/FixJ family response regulator
MTGLRVAVCDDNTDLVDVLGLMVTTEGHQVVGIAGEGAAAVHVVAETKPDLVLLDLNMPGVGGLDALPAIKAASPASRVIVISGIARDDLVDAALTAGADGYLVKGDAVTLRCVLAETSDYAPAGPRPRLA